MLQVTNGSMDNRPRQRLKDPDEKVKFEHIEPVNSSTIVLETQAGSCKSTGTVLLSWADIEPWRQYNRFIIRSYRPTSNSYLKSISSLGYIHDQTVNIYSHLLGAVGFVAAGCVLYQILSPRYLSATWADVAVFGAFAMGLFMCLTLSAAFHTFNNHSRNVYDLFFMFDMLGISFLIMGSFYPSIYYSFYCEPGPRYLYWAMVCSAITAHTERCLYSLLCRSQCLDRGLSLLVSPRNSVTDPGGICGQLCLWQWG